MTRGNVEVAHEALIRAWPRLRAWIDEDREGQRLHRRITADTGEWQRSGDSGLLYRGVRLAQALGWLRDHADAVNAAERDFLSAAEQQSQQERDAATQTERERQEAQQRELLHAQRAAEATAEANRRIRRRSWGLAALAVAAVALAAVSFQQRVAAELQRERADTLARMSLSRQLAAQSQDASSRQHDLSLLLALQAVRTHESKETLGSLSQAIDGASGIQRFLSGHGAWINAVAVSPDGRWVASAGDDEVVLLWDAASGRLLHRLAAQTSSVRALAFAPDSSWLVSVGHEGSVRLWQTGSGAALQSLAGASGELQAVAVSPDGRHIVAAGAQGQLLLWNVADGGAALPSPGTHTGGVRALGFVSEDTVVSGGVDGKLGLWTLGAVRPPRWVGKHPAAVQALSVHAASGAWVSAGADGSLLRWDRGAARPRSLSTLSGGLRSVAFSADGLWLAAGGDTREVVALRASDGEIFAHLPAHQAALSALAFAPDGSLYSASLDGRVIVWKPLGQQHRIDRVVGPMDLNGSALSPDGAILVLAGKDRRVVRTWLDKEGVVGEDQAHTAEVNSVTVSADGRWIASGGADHKVMLRAAAPAKAATTVFDEHGAKVWGVAFSADGRLLASAGDDNLVVVRDLGSTQPARRLQGHDKWVYGVAFSPDGRWLASSGGDDSIFVWDPASGALRHKLKAHAKATNGIAFSPDGQWLASAGDDHQVLLWRTRDWTRAATLKGHTAAVWAVAFSPDSRTLASASWDQSVALWGVAEGRMRAQMRREEGQLNAVAFTPDGKRLVASGSGRAVHLFNVEVASWPAQACRVANRNLTLDEWKLYVGAELPYVALCPGLPPPST